jgi:site-specific recombinase XerD
MKNKIVTHFYVKEAKEDSNGAAPIYLRITVNGERAEISTNRRINPEIWDKASERVAGRSESARIINTSLNNLISKVEKYFGNLDVKDEMISVHQIIAEVKGKSQNQMTLIKAYEYHIKKLDELSGIDFAVTTINKYRYSLNSLKRFLKTDCNKTDIRLCDLDHRFVERYHAYLRTTESLMHNSATKNIKNLFRIVNISISNKWININPFKSFSCNFIDTNRGYLTEEEIESIYKKDITINRLSKVRDVFIFQIYTGLSYIDMADLNEDSVEIGIDGKRWIVINRKKTGVRSSIPILPRAQEILDKYKADPICLSENKLLPVCTNQRMNGYLHEIEVLCDIKKNLTTHLARHTFATTITLSHGVPIETVSKMLGHTDLKTTQIYSKVVDRKIADDMKPFFTKPKEEISKKAQDG